MAIYVSAIDGMTSHDAGDVTRLETAFLTQEGVVGITATDLQVQAQGTPDMTVKVNPGSCFVLRDAASSNDNTLHFWHVIVTAITNVTIPTSDPSNPRLDRICVKIDTGASPDAQASNVATLVDVQGTAAGSPSLPAEPSNHLTIAQVRVNAGVTTITSSFITDLRVFVGFALPFTGGYNNRDTQGNLDGINYEDSSGRVVTKSTKSGGQIIIDPILNKIQAAPGGNGATYTLSGEVGIEFIIDGGGSAITTGDKGHIEVPFDCQIKAWSVLLDQSGSIVIDVRKTTYANFPPAAQNSIAGTDKPTVATATKNQNLAVAAPPWDVNLKKGDILDFNVTSITTAQRATLSLRVIKT